MRCPAKIMIPLLLLSGGCALPQARDVLPAGTSPLTQSEHRDQAPPVESADSTVEEPAASPPPARTFHPVAVGDSITQAGAGRDSFRRPLWLALSARAKVNFLGSQSAAFGGEPRNQDFDRDHEGHWGWRADEILANLPGWLEAYEAVPDIALIHLGSNDLFQGNSRESTIAELRQILEALRARNPGIRVFLAELIPARGRELAISELNAAIRVLARECDTEDSPVRAVDHFTGFDVDLLTYDGVHPNESGEEFMAERWMSALVAAGTLE